MTIISYFGPPPTAVSLLSAASGPILAEVGADLYADAAAFRRITELPVRSMASPFSVPDPRRLKSHPVTIRPRPYQTIAGGRVMQWVVKENEMRHLIVQPTGTGKTVTMAQAAHHLWRYGSYKNAVMVIFENIGTANSQTAETFERIFPHKKVTQIMGDIPQKDFSGDVLVVNVQSAINPKNMTAIRKVIETRGGVVFLDEAHHYVMSNSWGFYPLTSLNIFNPDGTYNPNNRIVMVGVTATIERTDGVLLSTIYGFDRKGRPNLRHVMSLATAIREGWLVMPRGHLVETSLSLKGVHRTANGEYDEKELSRKMRAMGMIDATVKAYLEKGWDTKNNKPYKGIVFAVDVEHAVALALAFQKALDKKGKGVADCVAYNVDKLQGSGAANQIIRRFKRGEIDILVNVAMLGESFDDPNVRVVQIARPTSSVLLYEQMVGRGLRPPDPYHPKNHHLKPDAIIIDMTTDIEEHTIDHNRQDLARLFGDEYEADKLYKPILKRPRDPVPVITDPQQQVRVRGYRDVELIRVGRSFGPHLRQLVMDYWSKDEIPEMPAYAAGIRPELLRRYMKGVEIPKKKSQVLALADGLGFSKRSRDELIMMWANDMADKAKIEAASGVVGTFVHPSAGINILSELPQAFVSLIEKFETDGVLPNTKDFARFLKQMGFVREAFAIENGLRFGDPEVTIRNVIRKLRERKLLPKKEMLPDEAAAILRQREEKNNGPKTSPPPDWKSYGIRGPRDGISLDAEKRLGWFLHYLILIHFENLRTAEAAIGLSATTLKDLEEGILTSVRPERYRVIREKLVQWAGKVGKEKHLDELMARLFDDFLAARLQFKILPEKDGLQRQLQATARAALFSKFGGLPPKVLQHRWQPVVNVASGNVDWEKVLKAGNGKEAVAYVERMISTK